MGLAELEERIRNRLRHTDPGEAERDAPETPPQQEQRTAHRLYPVSARRDRVEVTRRFGEAETGGSGSRNGASGQSDGLAHELTELGTRSRLARQALHDPLTDLLNRRALADRLAAELARAEREGHPIALVALDIDFFKQINDLCGHAVGDEVLRAIAQRLAGGVRPGDHAARTRRRRVRARARRCRR